MNSKSGHIQSAAIVGAGNVGTALAVALRRAGVEVRAVWSRCAANAEALARRVEAVAAADLRSMSERADVCIIAVSDNAIADVAQRLALGPATVVHTSGGTSIDVLRRFEHRGVVYPFQTFSKGVNIDFGRVPVMVEAGCADDERRLLDLADQLSAKTMLAGSEQRLALHVAAVLAANFSNHLIALASEYLNSHGIDPTLLHPLLRQTVDKACTMPPLAAQTGPAARHDTATIGRHLEAISGTELADIYQLLTESIIRHHPIKNQKH